MTTYLSALLRLALVAIAGMTTQVHGAGLVNPDFELEAGAWGDREGPPGWELRLDDEDQRGIVEEVGFAFSGDHAFHFSHLQRGFGGSRMDQCVLVGDEPAWRLSVAAMTEEPHPELGLRLRLDFFADDGCDEDSLNADIEQVQSDIGLSTERLPPGEWVRLESETRMRSELGEDVRSMRVSIRVRDRSDDDQPRDPARIVWLDAVSLDAELTLLPEQERLALRDLYQATDGEQWAWQVGWMGPEGTECQWDGVVCNDNGSHVRRLELPGNRLTGLIPESLADLAELEAGEGLDLCDNDLDFPAGLTGFLEQHQIGGDPEPCQFRQLVRPHRHAGGHFYQSGDRSGEGFMVHMLSQGSALLYWATYDDHGNPVWLFGTGRERDRIIHFSDLYRTAMEDGVFAAERVGRARVALVEADPECSRAEMRFAVEHGLFGANDRRQLRALDGLGGCFRPVDQDRVLLALEGQWYDPDRSGQGISLAPYASDRIILTWYGYHEDGSQVWRWGVGRRQDDRVYFDEVWEFFGGSFNEPMDTNRPEALLAGSAWIELDIDQEGESVERRFVFVDTGLDETVLELGRIDTNPHLQASTARPLLLDMAAADVDELYSRSIWSDERLPGRVRFGSSDEAQGLMGLRFRGSSSRLLPKKQFNVRFERPQALLYGSERMNLNAMYTDPAMMRERISFELWHQLGQPASRTRYFDFWLNDIYEGLYIHIQRVDEWLLTTNGLAPDGTLVRDQFRGESDLARSAFGHDFGELDATEREALIAENFNYRGDPDWASLRELIDWVRATPPGSGFAQGFEQRVDVENFVDWLVLHWLIGDIDSFGDDYWLYLDHADPDARWKFIPWDKDLSFGSHFRAGFSTDNDFFFYEYPLRGGWSNLLIERFLATDSLLDVAEQRLRELVEEQFPLPWFENQTTELAETIEDSVAIRPSATAFRRHDRNHHGQPGRFHDHVEALLDFVELRYRFISRQLDPVQGAPYQAEAGIPAGPAERILLTDATGFTIAAIEPREAVDQDSWLWIEVEQALEVAGIDREWTLEVGSQVGTAELTLFYRNEVNPAWAENWWTGGEEAVGDQDRLIIVAVDAHGHAVSLPTRVNPYSNKAVAELDLGPGIWRLRLELPDD